MPVTEFIWDELNDSYLMEADLDLEGATTAVYTIAPVQFGHLISQRREGSTSHFHWDGQHSTRQLTNSAQVATDNYIFSAFGDSVAASGTTINPFGYVGVLGYYSDNDILRSTCEHGHIRKEPGGGFQRIPWSFLTVPTNIFCAIP
jgi:hypothetical protein